MQEGRTLCGAIASVACRGPDPDQDGRINSPPFSKAVGRSDHWRRTVDLVTTREGHHTWSDGQRNESDWTQANYRPSHPVEVACARLCLPLLR